MLKKKFKSKLPVHIFLGLLAALKPVDLLHDNHFILAYKI